MKRILATLIIPYEIISAVVQQDNKYPGYVRWFVNPDDREDVATIEDTQDQTPDFEAAVAMGYRTRGQVEANGLAYSAVEYEHTQRRAHDLSLSGNEATYELMEVAESKWSNFKIFIE